MCYILHCDYCSIRYKNHHIPEFTSFSWLAWRTRPWAWSNNFFISNLVATVFRMQISFCHWSAPMLALSSRIFSPLESFLNCAADSSTSLSWKSYIKNESKCQCHPGIGTIGTGIVLLNSKATIFAEPLCKNLSVCLNVGETRVAYSNVRCDTHIRIPSGREWF